MHSLRHDRNHGALLKEEGDGRHAVDSEPFTRGRVVGRENIGRVELVRANV